MNYIKQVFPIFLSPGGGPVALGSPLDYLTKVRFPMVELIDSKRFM